VRRICANCRESVVPDTSILNVLRVRPDFDRTIQLLQDQGVLGKGEEPLAGIRLFRGKGCAQCHGSGFRGRVGVFELFEVDDQIRGMIMERQDTSAIRAEAIARGMKTMFQDGLPKSFLGKRPWKKCSAWPCRALWPRAGAISFALPFDPKICYLRREHASPAKFL
jgi:type IV pilus assembly protein PilB